MKFSWITNCIGWVLCPVLVFANMPDSPIYILEKSIKTKGHYDLSSISRDQYSEIRWDSDADQFIDVWMIQKGPLHISQQFNKGRLAEILVESRMRQGILILKYEAVANGNLKLVGIQIVPYAIYSSGSFKARSMASEAVPVPIPVQQECRVGPYEKAVGTNQWKEFQCRINQEARKKDLDDAIDPTCKSLLDFSQYKQLRQAVDVVYGTDFLGPIEHNQILNCMAKGPPMLANTIYPRFLANITTEFVKRASPEITCEKNSDSGCGKAKYQSGDDKIRLPVSKPPCVQDMKQVFTERILHEKLHQASFALQDEDIEQIVKACYYQDGTDLNKVNWKPLTFWWRQSGGIMNEAEVQQAVADVSREIGAKIPVSVAEGEVSKTGGGLGLLNNAFRSVASVGSPDAGGSYNPNATFEASVKRTAGPLNTFAFLASGSRALAMPMPPLATGVNAEPSSSQTVAASDSARSPASVKAVKKASNKVSGASAGAEVATPSSGGAVAGSSVNEKLNSNDNSDSDSSAAPSNQASRILSEVTAVKDPVARKALLEKMQKDFVTNKIYIFDKELGRSFGVLTTKALYRCTLIKGECR